MAANCTWKILFLLQLIAQAFASNGRLLEPPPQSSALAAFHPAPARHNPARDIRNQPQKYGPISYFNSSTPNVFLLAKPPSGQSENQLTFPGPWLDPEDSWNPVIGVPVAMLRWIVKAPLLAVAKVIEVFIVVGWFSGEFHALIHWFQLDFKHENCSDHVPSLHEYPKSPEQEAQELGALPAGLLKSTKTYGGYYLQVLQFHAGMIISLIISSPFMIFILFCKFLNYITMGYALKTFRFIVGKDNPIEDHRKIAKEQMQAAHSGRFGYRLI